MKILERKHLDKNGIKEDQSSANPKVFVSLELSFGLCCQLKTSWPEALRVIDLLHIDAKAVWFQGSLQPSGKTIKSAMAKTTFIFCPTRQS